MQTHPPLPTIILYLLCGCGNETRFTAPQYCPVNDASGLRAGSHGPASLSKRIRGMNLTVSPVESLQHHGVEK